MKVAPSEWSTWRGPRPVQASLPVILALCYPPPATAPGPLRARAEAVETGHSKLEGVSHSKRSAHQPDDPDPTGPGCRRRGSPAGPHAHASGTRDGAGAGIRPRRGRPDGLSAGGQISRLRAVQVRAHEARQGGQAPAAIGDVQGSPPHAEDRLG